MSQEKIEQILMDEVYFPLDFVVKEGIENGQSEDTLKILEYWEVLLSRSLPPYLKYGVGGLNLSTMGELLAELINLDYQPEMAKVFDTIWKTVGKLNDYSIEREVEPYFLEEDRKNHYNKAFAPVETKARRVQSIYQRIKSVKEEHYGKEQPR